MRLTLPLILLFVLVGCSEEETDRFKSLLNQDIDETNFVYREDITYDSRTDKPVTGRVVKYKEGQLKRRAKYSDGKRNGLAETFHDNGQLQTRENYKDEKRHGLFERFDKDGNLVATLTYKDDKLVECTGQCD